MKPCLFIKYLLILKCPSTILETTYAVMLIELGLVSICQFVSIVVAAALLIASAMLYDLFDRPLSWFSHVWLMAGLYGAPLLLSLLAGPAVYLLVYRRRLSRSLHLHKEIESLMFIPRAQHVQLFLHAHAVLLTVAVFAMTAMGLRMTYLLGLGLVFYGISMLINYVTRFNLNGMYLFLFRPIELLFIPNGYIFDQTRDGCTCTSLASSFRSSTTPA